MKLRIVAVNDVYVLDSLPRLRTLIRRAAEVDPADALLVTLAGDFLSPSILSSIDAGRGMVECLNAIGVTHVTFGNHEDDLDTPDLLARAAELRAIWLATNVRGFSAAMPESQVIEVAGVRVGLLGVVMRDAGVYRRPPFGGVEISDPNESALSEAERLVRTLGCAFVIPLTHQFIDDDRRLARAGRERRMRDSEREGAAAPSFPVILGGHEHQSFLEEIEGTWIVKAKADAANAAIVDVTYDRGEIHTLARLEPVSAYEEDAEIRALVDRHMLRVAALEDATILKLPEGATLSSVGSRKRQTSMGSLLCSKVRDAVEADGCFINGGGVRGNRDYVGRFTYGGLRHEVPFDNEVVVVALPGRIVAEALAASRARAPAESGGFLQTDDAMATDDAGRLVQIAGAPLEPSREYRIALVRNLLLGLDDIEPLVRFVAEEPSRLPPADSGRDVRVILASAFAVALWKQIGGFDVMDADHDGRVTAPEIAAALVAVHGAASDASATAITAGLVVTALDTNRDGVVSREEADAVES